jgi:putative transposase
VAPQDKREVIVTMVMECQRSERRACALVGLSRDSYRNAAPVSALNQQLSAQIIAIAHQRHRAGYRMIHDLLRPEHPGINHKRIYRLYSEAGLAVRRKVKAKRYGERVPLVQAETLNQTWSMDFVSDSLSSGRRLKFLTVTDDFSRECVQMAVDFGMGAGYVTRLLDEAAVFRGYPTAVRTDNGPEFTAKAFLAWTQQRKIEHILIEPGCPTQNAYIESFNGTFRDECLNEHWFSSLGEARAEAVRWRKDYNEVRPHSNIGRIPPSKFAAQHRQLTADAAQEHDTSTQNSSNQNDTETIS